MNYHDRNNAKQVIRFNKWSNTSYAVFNSIGKVILIGKLSKIISGLVSVKSIASKRLAYLIDVLFTEKEKLSEFIEPITADELLNLKEISFRDVILTYTSKDVLSAKNIILLDQQNYIEALKGLFSCVELAQAWRIRHFLFRIKIIKAS